MNRTSGFHFCAPHNTNSITPSAPPMQDGRKQGIARQSRPMPAFSGDRRVAFRLAASICRLAHQTGLFPVGMPPDWRGAPKNTFCPMSGRALIGSLCRPVTAVSFLCCVAAAVRRGPGSCRRRAPEIEPVPALPSRKMPPIAAAALAVYFFDTVPDRSAAAATRTPLYGVQIAKAMRSHVAEHRSRRAGN